jgi:DUF4097 and DUF4098 domain-containing protein YvlB
MKLRLAAVATVAAALTLAPLPAPASTLTYDTRGDLARGKSLSVTDINGNVRVRRGDALTVHATIKAQRSDPHSVRIISEATSDGYAICVRYPGDARRHCDDANEHANIDNNDTTVDFEITVPAGVNVYAKSVNGNVGVVTDGDASGITANGNVRLDAADVIDAKTVNGMIELKLTNAASHRPIEIASVNGSIDLTLPKSVGLRVKANVLNGDIEAGGLTVHRPQYGPGASVDGRIGDGARSVQLKTLNGNITLTRV